MKLPAWVEAWNMILYSGILLSHFPLKTLHFGKTELKEWTIVSNNINDITPCQLSQQRDKIQRVMECDGTLFFMGDVWFPEFKMRNDSEWCVQWMFGDNGRQKKQRKSKVESHATQVNRKWNSGTLSQGATTHAGSTQ
jgi:hypothetical protein